MNPDFGLFKLTNSKLSLTYIPNYFSYMIPNHLAYFKFFGILLAKAFVENWMINVDFA